MQRWDLKSTHSALSTYRQLRKQEQQAHSIQRMELAGEHDGKAIFIRYVALNSHLAFKSRHRDDIIRQCHCCDFKPNIPEK